MFLREQNFSLVNVFLSETLCITPRRHICLTQAVILSSNKNFVVNITTLCNNMRPSVKNINNVYIFHHHQSLERTSQETQAFSSRFKTWGAYTIYVLVFLLLSIPLNFFRFFFCSFFLQHDRFGKNSRYVKCCHQGNFLLPSTWSEEGSIK